MAGIAPGLDGFIAAGQLNQQRQAQELGMLSKLLQMKQAQEQAAAQAEMRPLQMENLRSEIDARRALPAERAATREYTRQMGLSRLQQAATQAENTHQFRMKSLSNAEDRAAETARHNRFMEGLSNERLGIDGQRLYYDTGISVPRTTPQPPAAAPTPGAMAPAPSGGALSGMLDASNFPAVAPQVQATRDADAAALRARETNGGGGIPTASVIPGSQAGGTLSAMAAPPRIDNREFSRLGQTPAPLAQPQPSQAPVAAPSATPQPQQPAATTGGANYRAALAEVVPGEPPREKFKRLADARTADRVAAAAALKASQTEKTALRKQIPEIEGKQGALDSVGEATTMLDAGIYTGAWAPIIKGAVKWTPGVNTDKAARTEEFLSHIGNIVIPRLKEFGGNDSNEEMRYLTRVMGGDISLEEKALRAILKSTEAKIKRGLDVLKTTQATVQPATPSPQDVRSQADKILGL